MKKSVWSPAIATVAVWSLAATAFANRGNGALGTIYVTRQGSYCDTFVSAEVLPNRGFFQKLEMDGSTESGPGTPGYRGGR